MLRLGRSMRYPTAVIFIAAVLLAVGAPTASAGTFTVLSCRDRAGARTPLNDAGGGWVKGSTTATPGLDSFDYCDDPSRGFFATVSGTWAHPVGAAAWWRFVPPQGTLVEGADIYYSGYSRPYDNQNQGIIYFGGAQSGDLGHHYGEGNVSARWLSRHGLHDAWFQATAQCDGPTGHPDCPADIQHATIEISRSEVALSDTSPPDAGAATGSAVSSPTWQGPQAFAFPAADQGGGVYQAILDVDGTPVLGRTIDAWGGRCVDTTAGGRVFRYPQPCLTAVDALVPVDASTLPAGDHDV